jgi:hypothetical protein
MAVPLLGAQESALVERMILALAPWRLEPLHLFAQHPDQILDNANAQTTLILSKPLAN